MQIERTRYHTVHGIIPKINEKYSGFTTRYEKISLEKLREPTSIFTLNKLTSFRLSPDRKKWSAT